ncbi:MAG: hypothetical protein Q9163_001846 [Psora crenata]
MAMSGPRLLWTLILALCHIKEISKCRICIPAHNGIRAVEAMATIRCVIMPFLLGLGLFNYVSAQVWKTVKDVSSAEASPSSRATPYTTSRVPGLIKVHEELNSSRLTPHILFSYRIPGTSIGLTITTTGVAEHDFLQETLLRVWEYAYEHFIHEGDRPLPPEEDPFIWSPSGQPGGNPLAFQACSAPNTRMTWKVLSIALSGLHDAMPLMGRDYTFVFQIWYFQTGSPMPRGEGLLESVSGPNMLQDLNSTVTGRTKSSPAQLEQQFTSKRQRNSRRVRDSQ